MAECPAMSLSLTDIREELEEIRREEIRVYGEFMRMDDADHEKADKAAGILARQFASLAKCEQRTVNRVSALLEGVNIRKVTDVVRLRLVADLQKDLLRKRKAVMERMKDLMMNGKSRHS